MFFLNFGFPKKKDKHEMYYTSQMFILIPLYLANLSSIFCWYVIPNLNCFIRKNAKKTFFDNTFVFVFYFRSTLFRHLLAENVNSENVISLCPILFFWHLLSAFNSKVDSYSQYFFCNQTRQTLNSIVTILICSTFILL